MLERGKYGIEYTPQRKEDESRPFRRLLFGIVVVSALVSLVWTLVARYRTNAIERKAANKAEEEARQVLKSHLQQAQRAALAEEQRKRDRAETSLTTSNAASATASPEIKPKPRPPAVDPRLAEGLTLRPVKVRNLLMRLEEAEKTHDVELAVSTIEQIRALPGAPAADLDDALARRLGSLNVRRLFVLRNPIWVEEIVVKPRSSAARIAAERGSTLATLKRLNGGKVEPLIAGQRLYVLNHPRFNLIVRVRSRTADLQLNGKFFKRYDLVSPVTGKAGPYETGESFVSFCKSKGLWFKPADLTELEMLLPRHSAVVISEM